VVPEVNVDHWTPRPARLRTYSRVEPPRLRRAGGIDHDHEIRVALPPSYDDTDRRFPVLWVTDGRFERTVPALDSLYMADAVPELIVVSVGAPETASRAEYRRRRTFDFTPTEDTTFDAPGGRWLSDHSAGDQELRPGGAGRFLDFLVDDVRPELEREYRMDPGDHALIGFSGGGLFVGYALFARPGAFRRYVCGSPSLNTGNYRVFAMEEEYAAAHDDLDARIFLGAGADEVTEEVIAAYGCVSSMIRLAETLRIRNYPSLRMSVRIFPGQIHGTVWPYLLAEGVRAIYD
jgi:predicted alpha/beta superfamily hydrolase